MFCKYCGKEYQRISGVIKFRKDCGFCSIQCIMDSKEPCPNCGGPILLRKGEGIARFIQRKYCSQPCARKHANSKPKSLETRARMSKAAYRRSPEHLAKIVESRRRFYITEEGKQSRKEQSKRHSKWLHNNPKAIKEAARKQSETKKADSEANSARQKAFYQTPEGAALKEKYRRLYTGKKRPPRVVQKMKNSARKFWNSPEGWILRDRLSRQMTNGLHYAPYGPGWEKKASKIRQRDEHKCVISRTTKETNGRTLDVHHIYSRRMFGYIPGKNINYIWSDHPANLITLCQICHVKVDAGIIDVPLPYQERADKLWQIFTESC